MPLHRLYPAIDFPVSRGTPSISPIVKWDHRQDWLVCVFEPNKRDITSERKITIDISEQEYEFMSGHIIDGEYQREVACVR